MQLQNLELPSSEDISSLASRVSYRVDLDNVTGDISPLLSSLSCRVLLISNMELDQAGTSSLVRALQHGVKRLELWGGVRLHIQTLLCGSHRKAVLKYDVMGRCGEVECHKDTRDTYREDMKTWAYRVNWIVSDAYGNIIMKRK